MSIYKNYRPLLINDDEHKPMLRTYMNVQDGVYSLYLDGDFKREFTDETLPDAIKVILGLINAYDWDAISKRLTTAESNDEEAIIWRFANAYPSILLDIGWRQGNHYCLVLPKKVFDELSGTHEAKVRDMTVSWTGLVAEVNT